jgi:hypothetical protein
VSTAPIPNLFLVGAQKCGTTSMYEYLRRHPQIFFPFDNEHYGLFKEPQHFCPELEIHDKVSIKDRERYLALYRGSEDAIWRGDASTNYLFSERAAEAIKQFSPNARILIMLRPPVEWMHSYHKEMLRYHNSDIMDFYAAIDASEDHRNGLRIPAGTVVPRCLDYISMSRFAPQVERYYRAFGQEAVKVVLLEDMILAPAQTFREILVFLGVDSSFRPEFRVYNETPRNGIVERAIRSVYKRGVVKRTVQRFVPYPSRRRFLSLVRQNDSGRTTPDPRDERLREQCLPDVKQLATLIGRDLGHW